MNDTHEENESKDDRLFSSMANASIFTGTTSMRSNSLQKSPLKGVKIDEADKSWLSKLKPKWSRLLSNDKIINEDDHIDDAPPSSVFLSLNRLKRAISTKTFTRKVQNEQKHETFVDVDSISELVLRGYSVSNRPIGGGNPFLKTIYKPMLDEYNGEFHQDPFDHFLNVEDNEKIVGALLYFLNNNSSQSSFELFDELDFAEVQVHA